ncbi:glucosaminidase domain-containing protein [Staphylococcus sp. 17KM0847]|uniref:glucosaminidase domain-containing protein n=1 Tax=Staphylococcus sp. 17KM0847 TaxID=2583989 RepID=UPI0015DCA964|nr:glucosaminidase domain-containing protein [Staphylococcus sp. 17KM0847]QLK86833.1 CHAP domain-containing protein [Staphylococcus sp. 17KM0847]
MKGKIMITGLLTTALVASPTTAPLANAVTQKSEIALKQALEEDVDTTNTPLTSDDKNHNDQKNDTTKETTSSQSHPEHTKQNKKTVGAPILSEAPHADQTHIMDDFDRWLYSTATGDATQHTQEDISSPSSQTTEPSTQVLNENTHEDANDTLPSTSTDDRDFFDNLNAILNEDTSDILSDDIDRDLSGDDTNSTESNQMNQDNDPNQDTIDNTKDEEDDFNTSQNDSDNTSDISDSDTTSEEKEEETHQTEEENETTDTNEATQEGQTTTKEDILIEALLDEYSDKAKNTSQKQQSNKNESTTSSYNPQIPNKDVYQGTREQAPSQTFDSLPKNNPVRRTTWFQDMPSSTSQIGQDTNISAVPNQSTRKFINTIAKDAHRIGQEENLYASIMIAQAILESDSGRSSLAQAPNYNLFGMKGAYQGQSVAFNTLESNGQSMYQINADFRKYPSRKASLQDYATLLKKGIDGNPTIYKGLWKSESSSYRTAVTDLVGTYATDPDYDTKIKALIKTYDLTRFDHKKMPKLLDSDIGRHSSEAHGEDFKALRISGASPYPQGQCTWYVYHRMAQFGQPISGNMGNAAEWTTSAHNKGYHVSSQPKNHSAVVFQPGQLGADRYYGHVAFVEKVNKDGSIVISESNVKGLGVISYRTIDTTRASSLSYIQNN